jgi:hypothetical protein
VAASCEWRGHLRVRISSVVPIRSIWLYIVALCQITDLVAAPTRSPDAFRRRIYGGGWERYGAIAGRGGPLGPAA